MGNGAGVPSAVIRFACHIPLGILSFDGLWLYDAVNSLDIFQVLPHGQTFLQGLRIIAIAGIFAFAWNVILWIPTSWASGTALFLLGVGDLAITITLLVGVIFQSTYLPHTYSSCQGADTWQNATNTSNFFQVASTISDLNVTSAQDACFQYVENWAFGIAIVILYMISAIFNITLGGLNDESTYDCVLFSWLLSVIQWPFRVIHRRLVSPMLSRLRYKFRYFSKFRRRVKDHDTFSLRPLPTKLRKPNKPTALAVALNLESQLQLYNGPLNYDIWALIASRLHGVDLINLSLVSKSFRERIFPTSELGTRSEALRAYACDDGTKSQCWICNIKICDGCSSTCSLPGTELSFHLQNCKTYCSKCFYSQVCRAGKSKHSQYCRLKQNPKNRYFIPNFPNTTGKVCQLCVKRDSKEQQSRREARDRAEIERLTQQSLACSHCKVSIPMKGPRWWVCSECASECRHHIHPPWARKMEV